MLIKQQKGENLLLLLAKPLLYFKKKYIYNLHSEEYGVFLLYTEFFLHVITLYNACSISYLFVALVFCPIACNSFFIPI